MSVSPGHPTTRGHVAAGLIAALVGIGLLVTGTPPNASASASVAAPASAPPAPEVVDARVEAQQVIATAETAVADSEGRVLDDAPRVQLSALVEQTEQELRRAALLSALDADPRRAHEPQVGPVLQQIGEAITVVDGAVVEWEAEQARIAAEAEAARLAAEAAAAAPRAAAGRPAGAAAPFSEGIWTAGGQAEIDACRGSVNVAGIAGALGASFYAAEHWSCGGSAWSGVGTGALVTFPGYGVYQVAGVIGGLSYGADISVLPSGYNGYYQTCVGGSGSNMTVWLLTRV